MKLTIINYSLQLSTALILLVLIAIPVIDLSFWILAFIRMFLQPFIFLFISVSHEYFLLHPKSTFIVLNFYRSSYNLDMIFYI